MSVTIIISKVTAFKNLLQVLSNIIPKVIFKCTTKNIKIYAMESSHVALVEVELNNKWFKKYQCTQLFKLGVNVIELYDKIKNVTKNSVIYLSHNVINNQNLIVTIVTPGNVYNSFFNFFFYFC